MMETVTIKNKELTVSWKPHPGRQTDALKRTEFEVLYGGARGGGKTDAGLAWLTRPFVDCPDLISYYRGLVLRKNASDLSDWIDRATLFFRHLHGQIVGNPPVIKFPCGAFIRTGHMADVNAYNKYIGHEYARILIEELTQVPSEQDYLKIISSCRSTTGIKPQVFCTTNPGNVGHIWVKSRWGINGKPPYTVQTVVDPLTGLDRVFIPAKIDDNPTLTRTQPQYENQLNSLPEPLRSAWRLGDWDVFAGQYFSINPGVHGVEPFMVPDALDLVGSVDYGTTNPTSFGLWFQDKSNNCNYRIGEYYQAGLTGSEHARNIVNFCKSHPKTDGRLPKIIYADPSMWIKIRLTDEVLPAQSPAELFQGAGLNLFQANNDRINGWRITKELLHYNEKKEPEIKYFRGYCNNFESLMPMQIHDEKNVEDVKKTEFDHIADETRYYSIMMRPSVSIKEMYESVSTNEPERASIMDRDF